MLFSVPGTDRRTRGETSPDLDLTAFLFARGKLQTTEAKSRRSQTSLPPTVGHRGRRQRGGERLAEEAERGRLKQSNSPQGVL
jgi:hypothetical protein